MGVSLDDIIGNKQQDILVDKTKRSMNLIMIAIAVVVILIAIITFVMIMKDRTKEQQSRAAAITRDAEKISTAVKNLYSEYQIGRAELVGMPQEEESEDKIQVRYVNGQRIEFRLGYYYLTRDEVRALVSNTAPLELPAAYVVKYTTGEVVNLEGVKYEGQNFYEVSDLSAIANGEVPPSLRTLFINNSNDMWQIAKYPNNIIRLNANIDMSNMGGDGWNPVPEFSGTFDGRGYKIKGLRVRNSSADNAGLFGRLTKDAKIINLVLEDIDVSGKDNVGAIAGSCSGVVSNCFVSGRVSSAGRNVGGLFGVFEGSAEHLRSQVTVNGSQYVGGFAGLITGGTVTCCNVKGPENTEVIVTGDQDCVGGFVGQVKANQGLTLDRVSAKAAVSAVSKAGGLIGTINASDGEKAINIINSYSQGNIKNCNDTAGGFVGDFNSAGRASVSIRYCYTTCKPTIYCRSNRGGFVGSISPNAQPSVSFCYWERNQLTDESLEENGVGSTTDSSVKFDPLTPQAMILQTSYSGWDRDDAIKNWKFDNRNAPTLYWE